MDKVIKTPSNWSNISGIVVCFGFLLSAVYGIAGASAFGSQTNGIILSNFVSHYADPFKILLLVHLILYIPLDFTVMRHSLIKIIGVESGSIESYTLHSLLTVSMLIIITMMCLLLKYGGMSSGASFSVILNFTGGLSGSLTSFVLPASFFLKTNQIGNNNNYLLYYSSVFMMLGGLVIMILVPVLAIQDYNSN